MAKRFSLSEAESLIPQLDTLLRQAIEIKSEYTTAGRNWEALLEKVTTSGGMVLDRAKAIELRTARDQTAARLRAIIEQVQEIGCVVKDLDIGLIDFPTLFRGTEVYLCWKLGEAGITFWHGVDEGFRSRKAIDQDFIDNHQGDRAQ
jgi:hypothetical protein